MSSHSPIGVFDSGVGGLTVLRALRASLPQETFLYVGDTARVPYGNKSARTVKRFALEIASFFKKRQVKMAVVACNTVSALALPELRRFLPVPVLGVIESGARAALSATHTGRIGIIGTEATVKSQAYEKVLHRLRPSLTLETFSQACPLFVPLVEEGWVEGAVTREVARLYLKPLLAKAIDTLILGCTHYPLLKETLRKTAPGVKLIDSADETAKTVVLCLKEKGGLLSKGRGGCDYFSSDEPAKFAALGRKFLGENLNSVRRLPSGISIL
jgi:glutamate racemase